MHAADRQEYVEFVTAVTPKLRRTAYLLTGDAHRADDVVQQTLTRLYVKWGRARGADDVGAYVHRMLVNAFRQERRSRWFGVQLFDRAPEPTPRGGPPPGPGESVVDAVAVRAALAEVPPGQRVVLVLRFYADLSVEQTAEVLGCSTGNVKSQTARGLAALRRRLPLDDVTEVNR
ncbi:SigE family RNA polymerase sigma factor [Micromonospora coxensis]|uniref:RNA polymerase sigma-70 factor, sigma-E family n=1 Tax=Micromonospora coxensis TaxID=356852 RepID=A0A1C5JNN2_9ACTN|nr:SigE family RNA polymerase sigma factor [Micromonospora coxensis]SCG72127.1 RNA polymerase sigma-70 factor, sigma-E family [Micromonospora coxensis]